MPAATINRNGPASGLAARRPAVPLAAALMLGIFVHDLLPHSPLIWVICLAVLVLAAGWCFAHARLCSILLLGSIFVSGLCAAQLAAFRYPHRHISAYATDEPRLAQLELHIDHPPRVLTWPYGQYRALPPKQVATATVQRIKTWSGWHESGGQILVQIVQPHPRLRQGQVVRVIGMLQRPAEAMNPGQFDWASYYREQRVLASVQVAQADNITILSEPRTTQPVQWLRAQVRRALARGFAGNRALDHALLRALLLGDNDPELNDVQEQFRRTGTSHHLAISGMHVAVLGAVVFGGCRLVRLGPRSACWVSLLFVILYGIVAMPSPPVVRSVLLCACFALGVLHRRKTDGIQLLSVSVIVMLLYHPLDLYNAGFQLSFGTVLGLMLFTRPVMRMLPGEPDLDEQIARSMQRPGRFSIAVLKLKHACRATLAAAIVAWFISLPLIAFHFEQLNPWAIPASILLAPIVFLALVGGFAKVLLTLLLPSLSGAWAGIALMPVAWMRAAVEWLATFPGADVPLPAPPVWVVLAYYALLLLTIIPWPAAALRWSARSGALAGCAALAILPLREGFASVRASADELRITLLAVGGGQCAVIEPPGAGAVIIDAGSATSSDILGRTAGPFLRHSGRRSVQRIFISHANFDHFSAATEVATAYDVPAICVSTQFRAQSIGNPPAEQLLRALDALDRPPRQIAAPARFDIGPGAAIDVVWPPEHTVSDPNNCSMVLRLSYAGRAVLFTGDLQSPGQRELLETGQALDADVLIAPHHGSYEPTTEAFIAAVAPQYIIASNDRTLSSKQRSFDQAMRGRNVHRTHRSGAITVRIKRDGRIRVEQFLRP